MIDDLIDHSYVISKSQQFYLGYLSSIKHSKYWTKYFVGSKFYLLICIQISEIHGKAGQQLQNSLDFISKFKNS